LRFGGDSGKLAAPQIFGKKKVCIQEVVIAFVADASASQGEYFSEERTLIHVIPKFMGQYERQR
jgi:hypothetical protein